MPVLDNHIVKMTQTLPRHMKLRNGGKVITMAFRTASIQRADHHRDATSVVRGRAAVCREATESLIKDVRALFAFVTAYLRTPAADL
jgi:hypothetical protein